MSSNARVDKSDYLNEIEETKLDFSNKIRFSNLAMNNPILYTNEVNLKKLITKNPDLAQAYINFLEIDINVQKLSSRVQTEASILHEKMLRLMTVFNEAYEEGSKNSFDKNTKRIVQKNLLREYQNNILVCRGVFENSKIKTIEHFNGKKRDILRYIDNIPYSYIKDAQILSNSHLIASEIYLYKKEKISLFSYNKKINNNIHKSEVELKFNEDGFVKTYSHNIEKTKLENENSSLKWDYSITYSNNDCARFIKNYESLSNKIETKDYTIEIKNGIPAFC